ncbi:unnamed protein product [Adineta steineri]|uniref:MABP1/WDR62 second WD40 domain-containing protein n=1 Tax=Adineta steineri TaxID=433720 RepID=A0A814EDI5_9BILA|nr:unnamed protein product [Adineta steineri]
MSSNVATVRKSKLSSIKVEHVLGFTSISNSAVAQTQSTIAYAAGSTTVLYNNDTRKQDFVISNTRRTITSISFSPTGRYLATGEKGHNPKIRIWDLSGDRTSCVALGDHQFAINCVCFSTKPGYLVSIGSEDDGYICVWNLKNKTKVASNKCLVPIYGIAFAEDGNHFVTVGHHHVKFWNLIPKRADSASPLFGSEAILGEHKLNSFTDVICGRGSYADLMWTSSTNGLICQFDKNRKLLAHRILQKNANCLAISDSYLVVGCDEGVVYVLSLQTLESTMSIPLPHCLGVNFGFVNSQQQLNTSIANVIAITCFYNDHSFYIWDIKNRESIEKRENHMYHSACGWAIETCSRTDQLALITSSSDNTVRFWPLNHNEIDETLMKIIYLKNKNDSKQDSSESVVKVGGRCIKLSLDGLSLVIGDFDGNIRAFDMITFEQTACIEAHDNEILTVDFGQSIDMDVTFLATGGRDRFIHVFDASRNYQLITTLADHSAIVTAVRFTFSSITSKLGLISASADKSLIFRSISKDKNGTYQFTRLHSICEHNKFQDLAIHHQYNRIYTTCRDRTIRVYNIDDGKQIQTWKCSTSDKDGYLNKIGIDASGRYLAISCSNKYIYLWDLKLQECISSLCGHDKDVNDLKFSHDGHYLYSIAGDSCIFIWKLVKADSLSSSCQTTEVSEPKLDVELEKHQLEISSELTELNNEESFDIMVGPKDNESVLSNEDDETNVNNLDTTNEDDDLENSTIDTSQLTRENSLSSKFRQNSIQNRLSDTPWTEVNEEENDTSTPVQTSESLIFEAVLSESSTNPKNSDDIRESEDLCLSFSNITEQIPDSKTNQTEIDMQQEQVGSPISVVVDLTINNAKEDASMNDDRMSIVNDLTNEIFGCLDKLDNLYEMVTKSTAMQNTVLKESIEKTYSTVLKRININ